MSLSILTSVAPQLQDQPDTGHKRILTFCAVVAAVATTALTVYGFDYYLTAPLERPYHPKHLMLRPSGVIGWWLGVFGFCLFGLIFLYPLRKKWAWLGNLGNSRHWFNFHVLMGMLAPVVIAFHASFRFGGIAGVAYWIMFAVAASGIVGRYLYAQIPRSRNAAELSLQESKQLQERLTAKLALQRVVSPGDLARLFRLPTVHDLQRKSAGRAFSSLLWIDMTRPLRVARVRRQALGFGGKIATFGGLLASRTVALENVISVAKEQATISKKLLFLGKSQQVFQLWHIVHRPFSYSFAVLALAHVVIAILFQSR